MSLDHGTQSQSDLADFDARVRLFVYRHFVDEGWSPARAEVADGLAVPVAQIEAAFERLAHGKALVLQPESSEVLMAEPFSAVPTAFEVEVAGRKWWGNCIWDALGIVAMLGRGGRVWTSCGDCNEAMELVISEDRLLSSAGVVHYAVPVKKWWENVVFA